MSQNFGATVICESLESTSVKTEVLLFVRIFIRSPHKFLELNSIVAFSDNLSLSDNVIDTCSPLGFVSLNSAFIVLCIAANTCATCT